MMVAEWSEDAVEEKDFKFSVQRHAALTGNLMVWWAICHGSRSPLVIIPGTLNAIRYINNVTEPVLLPFLQELENSIFQQDNARPHTARVTMEYLHNSNVDMVPWPSRSSDLSLIEHIWDMIGRTLNDLQPSPHSSDVHQRRISESWDSIPQLS